MRPRSRPDFLKRTAPTFAFPSFHRRIEMIRMDQINAAYERMLKSEVKYRFVIDMASLKNA